MFRILFCLLLCFLWSLPFGCLASHIQASGEVKISSSEQIAKIVIQSLDGKIAAQRIIQSHTESIPITELSQGIYLIQCFDPNGRLVGTAKLKVSY